MSNSLRASKYTRRPYTPEDFVLCWQQADHPWEVAAIFGLATSRVCALASYFRWRGVCLKQMKRGPKGSGKPAPFMPNLDVLNAIVVAESADHDL